MAEVSEFQVKKNKPFKVLLIFDGAPCHTDVVTQVYGEVKVVFLPPNTTPLLQPLDQNPNKLVKISYVKNLMRSLVESESHGVDPVAFIKSFNIKDMIPLLTSAWYGLSPRVIKNSWKHLLPNLYERDCSETQIEDSQQVEILVQHELEPISHRLNLQLQELLICDIESEDCCDMSSFNQADLDLLSPHLSESNSSQTILSDSLDNNNNIISTDSSFENNECVFENNENKENNVIIQKKFSNGELDNFCKFYESVKPDVKPILLNCLNDLTNLYTSVKK